MDKNVPLRPEETSQKTPKFFVSLHSFFRSFRVWGLLLFLILIGSIGLLLIKLSGSKNNQIFITPTLFPANSPLVSPTSNAAASTNVLPRELKISIVSYYAGLSVESTELKPQIAYSFSFNSLSPDKNFFFFYNTNNSANKCSYAVYKKADNNYVITPLLGENIDCSFGQGMVMSNSFYRWIDDKTFILEETPGIIKLINISDFKNSFTKQPIFQYDSNQFSYASVDNSLNYWLLLRKNEQKQTVAVLVDRTNKQLINDLVFKVSDEEHLLYGGYILYDSANNGFLFTKRHYSLIEDTTWAEFQFLSLDNLQLKTVKITHPVATRHMGCGGFDYLTSTKGEIKVSIGCVSIGSEDRDNEGFVNIKL